MNDNFDQQRLGNASQVFGSTSDDTALPFKDKYTTEEQKQRDTEVTRLLAAYVKTYEEEDRKECSASKTFYFTLPCYNCHIHNYFRRSHHCCIP